MSAQMPDMCGVAKLLPVARIVAAAEPGDARRRRRGRRTPPAGPGCSRSAADRAPRGCRPRSPTRTATDSSRPACCAPTRRGSCGLKYGGVGELVQHAANCRFVVERLMLITSKPCSIAQRRPASSDRPAAGVARRRARGRCASSHRARASGRSRRTRSRARRGRPPRPRRPPSRRPRRPRSRPRRRPRRRADGRLDAAVEDADATPVAGRAARTPTRA